MAGEFTQTLTSTCNTAAVAKPNAWPRLDATLSGLPWAKAMAAARPGFARVWSGSANPLRTGSVLQAYAKPEPLL